MFVYILMGSIEDYWGEMDYSKFLGVFASEAAAQNSPLARSLDPERETVWESSDNEGELVGCYSVYSGPASPDFIIKRCAVTE